MSLNDAKYNVEMTVIKPLQHFRTLAESLDQVHNDSLGKFSQLTGGLLTGSDGGVAFQGQGADAVATLIGDYLNEAQKLTGSSNTFLCQRLADAANICEKHARYLQTTLDSIQPAHLAEAANIVGGLAIGADEGAAAQLGIDVPWDVVAAGATLIAGGLYLANLNSESTAIHQVEQAKETDIYVWSGEMDSGPNTEPLPRLPKRPEGSNGDSRGFFKLLGLIAAVGAGGVIVYNIYENWPVNPRTTLSKLSPQELEQLKQFLSEQTGCSPAQIQAIIDKLLKSDPTGLQLKNLLDALKIKAQLEVLKGQVESAKNPAYNKLLKQLDEVINSIDKRLKFKGNTFPKIDGVITQSWANNLKGASLQWNAGQSVGATNFEVPLQNLDANGNSRGSVDIIGKSNIFYESKGFKNITQGSEVFDHMVDQLANYISDPQYAK
ncbi:MAG TPA: hypothetical protein VFN23_05120, partial [Ktedonobacteraceae bacterium]|nr:hypothetical protein [Ktedonobacteraceae bacterium]